MRGNAIVDGRERVGLFALGHALREAHERTGIGEVVTYRQGLALHADGGGDGRVLAKDVGGSLDGHGAGSVIGTRRRLRPLHGEACVENAVGHGRRSRFRQDRRGSHRRSG